MSRLVAAAALILAAMSVFLSAYLYVDVQQARERRVADQAVSDFRLCVRAQRTERILSDLIRGVQGLPRDPSSSPERRRQLRAALDMALEDLEPTDCTSLPSQRPFN